MLSGCYVNYRICRPGTAVEPMFGLIGVLGRAAVVYKLPVSRSTGLPMLADRPTSHCPGLKQIPVPDKISCRNSEG